MLNLRKTLLHLQVEQLLSCNVKCLLVYIIDIKEFLAILPGVGNDIRRNERLSLRGQSKLD